MVYLLMELLIMFCLGQQTRFVALESGDIVAEQQEAINVRILTLLLQFVKT